MAYLLASGVQFTKKFGNYFKWSHEAIRDGTLQDLEVLIQYHDTPWYIAVYKALSSVNMSDIL